MYKNQISLVINSFAGSQGEFSNSIALVEYFKSKKIKVNSVVDINQELNLEKSQRVSRNIRQTYHQSHKLFLVNSSYEVPQVIYNDSLVLTYNQFHLLNEYYSNILNQLNQGKRCHHLRFFKEKLVYPKEEEDDKMCIYCYSQKKVTPLVTLYSNVRNYDDEENNEIISFCEENEMTIKLVDIENDFSAESSSQRYFVLDGKKFELSKFYEALEKRKTKSKYFKEEIEESQIGANAKFGQKNPYNFIEKLKLKKIEEKVVYLNINDFIEDDIKSNVSFN